MLTKPSVAETPVTASTFYLGFSNSLANLLIMLAAPILGAMVSLFSMLRRVAEPSTSQRSP